ncbi:HEAT repeat domain-containing protein [Sinosporangium album]|uniref:HEAT repeat domain-containing protein n=1 Tax=Sinosporangium album TaxID=504805 RepID=UPI00115FCD06|nr:HEAT repeat domain-containing protein [Sinosporangium album]
MIESAAEFLALRLGDDPAGYNRAARDSAPLEIWLELVTHHSEAHFWVAQNKTVPIEILRILTASSDWRARSMVAGKNKATPDMLEALAKDDHDAVRHVVAGHRNTPTSTLVILCRDTWKEVRRTAQDNLQKREKKA